MHLLTRSSFFAEHTSMAILLALSQKSPSVGLGISGSGISTCGSFCFFFGLSEPFMPSPHIFPASWHIL